MVLFAGAQRAAEKFDPGNGVELVEEGLFGFVERVCGKREDACGKKDEGSQEFHHG
jgi:hypothetical protein